MPFGARDGYAPRSRVAQVYPAYALRQCLHEFQPGRPFHYVPVRKSCENYICIAYFTVDCRLFFPGLHYCHVLPVQLFPETFDEGAFHVPCHNNFLHFPASSSKHEQGFMGSPSTEFRSALPYIMRNILIRVAWVMTSVFFLLSNAFMKYSTRMPASL